MMIDFSLIKIIPADESHREFSYQVKKAAEGDYITELFGWDEKVQIWFHTEAWQRRKPDIITYAGKPIGTIAITENENYIEIGQFFILPEYQNKGIGSYILKGILNKADQSGRTTKLAYLKNNPVATLYIRHGFEIIGKREEFCFMERQPRTTIKRKRKYEAVIFDLFGTIIDNFSRSEYESVLAEMAAILKTPFSDFQRLWLGSFTQRATGAHANQYDSIKYICGKLNIKASKAQIEHAFQVRLDYTKRSVNPRPEALEVLKHLKKEGYKIGLISDCSGETPMVWGNTPFVPFFNVTVFSCVARVKKPDPRIYRMATERMGVKPQECLYIGDGSSKELTGARQVGMTAVLIRDPNDSADAHYIDREDNWPGLRISSLKEVLKLVM